mgnify:CR=1 FL=1
MKTITALILVLIMFSQICFGQNKKEKIINWDENRPLIWEDFKGRASRGLPYDAQTYAGLSYELENLAKNEYKFKLNVNFDTKKSWVKRKEATDKLLIHEQSHFDIYEIYARLLVKRLQESNPLSGQKFSDKVKKVFLKTYEELVKFGEKYDKETNHSKNEEKQKEWTEKINKMLEDNKKHAKRELIFKVK